MDTPEDQTLQQLMTELNEDGADIAVRSYSGRCMYGKTCLAFVSSDPLGSLQTVASEAGKRGIEMPEDVRQDAMGRSTVIYWPSEPFDATDAGEEEGQ